MMQEVTEAQGLLAQVFNLAGIFVALIQDIELAIQSFEQQLSQFKQFIYQANNIARANLDSSITSVARIYSTQQLFHSPNTIFWFTEKIS